MENLGGWACPFLNPVHKGAPRDSDTFAGESKTRQRAVVDQIVDLRF
jgi:hypothetical protein